ncbi:MAG TPA: YceD family protein [Rhizomicrobium sp.]
MTAPFEHIYDLSRLSDAGDEIALAAKGEELKRLAVWFEVTSVEKLSATITLAKLAPNRFRYDAAFVCDLTQDSVVSLEPVSNHVEAQFSRELHVAQRMRRAAQDEPETIPLVGDEDVPEVLDNPRFDLAGPLLEEMSLALDPYPRAPGEAFAGPAELGDRSESPFAVLKKLKDSG